MDAPALPYVICSQYSARSDAMYCDLHAHSTASDGTAPPNELAALAKDVGLSALALTDHDTTAGIKSCAAACLQAGITFVPGIELTADPASAPVASGKPKPTGTLHILGLFIQPDSPHLRDIYTRMAEARDDRNPQIIEILNTLGLTIDYQEVIDLARDRESSIVSRPHIAQVMVNKRYTASVSEAFNRYLGEGAPAYIPRRQLSAAEAIDAAHQAGGLAVLAHPIQLKTSSPDELKDVLVRLQTLGLDGIETRHSDHSPADTERYQGLARKIGLLESGGSDYHGPSRPAALGGQSVPYAVYERLRDANTSAPGRASDK